MPYLTPQSLPEDDNCRPLSIPADSEWLALFGGALTELIKSYNWEYSGGLTVDETVEKMTEIINNWYSEPCGTCELPGGGSVIRIGSDGEIEELIDGEWSEPSGDYVIPDPEAREGGTEQDQICLAAKNATNVLEQLYENLSESWGSHLSEAEAATEFTLALIALVGFEFAPITAGVVAFFAAVFAVLYTALEYLGADLWDEAFTDQMVCFLVDCAENDAGVVTFDWECFTGKLNSLADSFGLTELQLRLYLQVSFILYFIGGVKGLNLAGATTEITNDDCSDCDNTWCWQFRDDSNLSEWTAETWGGGVPLPTYSSGQWNSASFTGGGHDVAYLHIRWVFDDPVEIFDASLDQLNSCSGGGQGIWINGDGSIFSGDQILQIGSGYIAGTYMVDSMDILLFCIDSGFPDITTDLIQISGTGDNPFGEDNCE